MATVQKSRGGKSDLQYFKSVSNQIRPQVEHVITSYINTMLKRNSNEQFSDDVIYRPEAWNWLMNEYMVSRTVKGKYVGPKKLRPIEHIELFLGYGGDPEKGVYQTAASSELVHESSLAHDDINDRDKMRYGTDTIRTKFAKMYFEKKKENHPELDEHKKEELWREAQAWGDSKALLIGDLLLGLSQDVLNYTTFPSDKISKLNKLRNDLYIDMVLGVSREVDTSLNGLKGVTDPKYMEIIRNKSNIHKYALLGAAILTGQDDKQQKLVSDFSDATIEIFQMSDDMLLLKYAQKDAWTDIRDGRSNILNIETLKFLEKKRDYDRMEKFHKIVGQPNSTKEDCQKIIDMMVEQKIPEKVIERMEISKDRAKSILPQLKTTEEFQRFGKGLIQYFMVRDV